MSGAKPALRPSARLTPRALNRATLARQRLLQREAVSVPKAIGRLIALQAQLPGPPYVGLWTRIAAFDRADLAQRVLKRELVRAPLLRGTLHLATADDYATFRTVVQPVMTRGFNALAGDRRQGIEPLALAEEVRPFLQEAPRTQDEVRVFLSARHPKLDERMMGHAVRMHLPLVQVPEAGVGEWDFPREPKFALAETWIGRPMATAAGPHELVRRYLAAFGPATAADVQTWSGLQGLRETMETLRPELRVLADERGRELFDLPDAPQPEEDEPAPVRFLPEYDNLLLAHADRARIVPDAFRKGVFLPGLRVAATFLCDGFVRGAWKVERVKKAATLTATPFAALTKKERDALDAEGTELARFLEPEATTWEVRFAKG